MKPFAFALACWAIATGHGFIAFLVIGGILIGVFDE